MVYELVLVYGIIAIFIGIGPIMGYSIWRFGYKKELWYSWLLGGLFWALALITSSIALMNLISIFETAIYFIYIIIVISVVFETVFRILLFILFTKFTADTSEKVLMAGFGWATFEAVFSYTIPFLLSIIFFRDNNFILQMDGIEFLLLFGGYKRFLTEVFQLVMIVMVFYGIKGYLKNDSEPIKENFFSRDPKPVWIWIIIVAILQITYNFLFFAFLVYLGFYLAYLLITIFIGVLVYYIVKRINIYPLFTLKSVDFTD